MKDWKLGEYVSVAYVALLVPLALTEQWTGFAVVAAYTSVFVFSGWRPWSPWYK